MEKGAASVALFFFDGIAILGLSLGVRTLARDVAFGGCRFPACFEGAVLVGRPPLLLWARLWV